MIDRDTVRLASRERDLATLLTGDTDVLPDYQQARRPVAPRPAGLELFRRGLHGYARQCAEELR